MDKRVFACFLALAVHFAAAYYTSHEEGLLNPLGWKFKKESNGRCYVHKYQATSSRFSTKKDDQDPLRNYSPIASYQLDCHEGHSTVGMNFLWKNKDGRFVLGICFFFPEYYQRIICQYLDKEGGFTRFVDAYCNDDRFTREDKVKYFFLGPVLQGEVEDSHVDYCVDKDCCRVDASGNVELVRIKEHVQFDANQGKLQPMDTGIFSAVYPFHPYVFSYLKDEDFVDVVNDGQHEERIFLGRRYDFISVPLDNDSTSFDFKARYTFTGFKYVKDGKRCAIRAENADSKWGRDMAAPCYERPIKEGYNIEWSLEEQTAYLRVCFVVSEYIGHRIVCHRFKNGTLQPEDPNRKIDYFFRAGNILFLEEDITNVLIISINETERWFKNILVETVYDLCMVNTVGVVNDTCYGQRTPYSRGFDPTINMMIRRLPADGTLDGINITASNNSPMYSLGVHIFIGRGNGSWIVFKDGIIVEKDNWDYSYIVEETAVATLIF